MRPRAWVLGLTMWACQPARPALPPYPPTQVAPGGAVIAKIGPVSLTTRELDTRIAAMNSYQRDRLKDAEKRREYVEQQVRFEILAQEGWRRGLITDPQVIAEAKKAVVQALLRDELEKRAHNTVVTEEETRALFQKRAEDLNKPERVRLSQIFRKADSATTRVAARKMLEKLSKEIGSDKQGPIKAFEVACQKLSEDEASKPSGGDLQFLTRAEVGQRFGAEAAKIMFEASPPLGTLALADTPIGVVLLSKTGFRHAVERAYDSVKAQLRAELLRQKRTQAIESMVAEMKQQLGVAIDPQAVEQLAIASAQPGSMPTAAAPPVAPSGEGSEEAAP